MAQLPEQDGQPSKIKTSSSGLFGSFAGVTGGRSATMRQIDTSVYARRRSVNVGSLMRDAQHKLPGSEQSFKTGSYGQRSEFRNTSPLQPHRFHGPVEMQDAVDQLATHNSLETRLEAAKRIMTLLTEYTVDNVAEVWLAGKDLIETEDKAAIVIGYELFLSCVQYQTTSILEKRLFFDSLSAVQKSTHLASRLSILDQLTNRGRDVEGLELLVVPFVARLLRQCYEAASVSRQSRSKSKIARVVEEIHLNKMFQYVLDLVKYNSRLLRDSDIDLLLGQAIWICRRTNTESDIAESIRVFDAVLTYSHIPSPALRSFVEVMCGIYCGLKDLRMSCWSAFRNLLNSHLGPDTVTSLLDVLRENAHQDTRNINTIRGAVMILHEILMTMNKDEFPQPSITDSIRALRESTAFGSARLECDIIRLLRELFRVDDARRALLGGTEWSDFVQIISSCTQRLAASTTKAPAEHFNSQHLNDSAAQSDPNVQLGQELQRIGEVLLFSISDLDYEHQLLVMQFLARHAAYFDDNTARGIIDFFHEEHLLLSSEEDWLENSQQLLDGLMKHVHRSQTIRVLCLNTVLEAYSTFGASNFSERNRLMVTMMENVQLEEDIVVLETLTKYAEHVAVWTLDTQIFATITDSLKNALYKEHNDDEANTPSSATLLPQTSFAPTSAHDEYCASIAKSLVRVFLRSLNLAAWKCQQLYYMFLGIVKSKVVNTSAKITFLKLLVRLRSDVNGALFVSNTTEAEHLASTIGRTGQVFTNEYSMLEPSSERSSRSEEQSSRRRAPVSASSSHSAKPGSSRSRPGTEYKSVVRRVPPLWMYPGPNGLPEDPPSSPSGVLFAHIDSGLRSGDVPDADDSRAVIDTSQWLDIVLFILEGNDFEWEIYSYIIVHLSTPLRNHSLFPASTQQIRAMRTLITSQLSHNNFPEPPAYTNQKKADVSICLYHVLTVLVSYRHYYNKNEEDEIVRTFLLGFGSRDGTSECCIHALTICCHELPMSISKSLENILHKMAQTITQSAAAVHILEFLAGLARLPELFKNFREEEFRMVFGICFRYLQYVRDPRSKGNTSSSGGPGGSLPRNVATTEPGTSQEARGSSLPEELSQYVYALTYHVMTFWFMSLKLQDRPHQMAWITRNLVYKDSENRDVMEEQAQVTVDMMQRVAFSDRDDSATTANFSQSIDGVVSKRSWLVGLSILTIETAGRSGKSQITRRRPTSTKYSILTPSLQEPPRHQVAINRGLAAESYYTESYVGVLPEDILQEYYSPQHLSSAVAFAERPIPLPDDDATTRAMGVFDRIPATDGHKVGIIYIGEDQCDEATILANVMGSEDYTTFLERIGTLTRLKGAAMNTQGLDREFDTDGAFAVCWRDRTSELVFHVTTMMPTNTEHDPRSINKKRHIGNDFVNIIFNNAGRPFAFDTFPSQFNYVNIVITPEARASFVTTRLRAQAARTRAAAASTSPLPSASGPDPSLPDDPNDTLFYNVTVLTAPGLPRISPAHQVQTVSGASLPAFVRLLALNASVFCGVWDARARPGPAADDAAAVAAPAEYPSSWRSRLREIVKLRDKHRGPAQAWGQGHVAGAAAGAGPGALPPLNTGGHGFGGAGSSAAASAHAGEPGSAVGGLGVGGGGGTGGMFRKGSVFGGLEPVGGWSGGG